MECVLEARNLTIIYGKGPRRKKAVDDLSFSVRKGEIFGFLGPNGAGKTSTIKALLGLGVPEKGSVLALDQPISHTVRTAMGYMPETANYYWYLTPKELLTFYGKLFGIGPKTLMERIRSLLALIDLQDSGDRLMKTFSKGMLQKVNLIQCMINDPELLILDEPTTGLDPISRMKMRDVIIDLKARGKTIFFSSHELSEVETISDRVAILKKGKLLKETSPKNIIDEKGARITLEQYFFDLVKDTP